MDRMIFNAFAQLVPSHLTSSLWRTPWGRANEYHDLDTWLRIVRTIEAAKFDGLFLADHTGILGPYGGDHRFHAEDGLVVPNNHALVMASALIGATENLSLGFTSSLIQSHPYEFARAASTFDHLSKGRTVWNVVTSALANAYRNMGFADIPGHEERYRRADEYMDLVYSLWEGSWDVDAAVKDVDGVYADPEKVFFVDHVGEIYRSEGPHLCEPSPQRMPFIYTAGMSDSALRLAATHAEALLIQGRTPEDGRRIVDQLNGFVEEQGRRPGDVKVIQLLKFVVGGTDAEAQSKYDAMLEVIDPRGAAATSGGVMGFDLGELGLDEEFEIESAPGYKGLYGAALLEDGSTTTTIHRMVDRATIHPFLGTPDDVVDHIKEWQAAGIDGINVADYHFHFGFVDFAEMVMPRLQSAGMAQTEYAPGTFREKVFGEGPFVNERHPAARKRGALSRSLAKG